MKKEGRSSRGIPSAHLPSARGASTVARGTIKPHDRRYRNRLPWLSYVICFTSRPACERGQTSGQIEGLLLLLLLLLSTTASFTIHPFDSSGPLTIEAREERRRRIETRFLIAIDRGGKEKEKNKRLRSLHGSAAGRARARLPAWY